LFVDITKCKIEGIPTTTPPPKPTPNTALEGTFVLPSVKLYSGCWVRKQLSVLEKASVFDLSGLMVKAIELDNIDMTLILHLGLPPLIVAHAVKVLLLLSMKRRGGHGATSGD
jgi:hypothetical protein